MNKFIMLHNEKDCKKVQGLIKKFYPDMQYTVVKFEDSICHVESLYYKNFIFDLKNKKLFYRNKEIPLTEIEYSVLELLQGEESFFTLQEINYALCIGSAEKTRKILDVLKDKIPEPGILQYADKDQVRWIE